MRLTRFDSADTIMPIIVMVPLSVLRPMLKV